VRIAPSVVPSAKAISFWLLPSKKYWWAVLYSFAGNFEIKDKAKSNEILLSFVSQGNGSFRSWAYVVLLNTCYSAYRKAKKEKTISLDEYEEALLNIPDLAKTEESKISFDFALSLISKLPAKLYKTAHQYFLEGKSQKEIALAEGTTDGAIRTRIHRARNFIEKLSKKTEKEGT
jgi:RNA polymerase sigma factor (sigma-70 family)